MEDLVSSFADVMVSALFSFISDRLSSSEFFNLARKEQVLSQLNRWKNLLPKINAVLHDAEQNHTGSRALNLWLSDLRDLAYDAEDIIDEVNTEALCRRIRGYNQFGTTSKVRFFFPPCCVGLNSSGIKFSGRLRSEIEAITARFQQIVEYKNVISTGLNSSGIKLSKNPVLHGRSKHIHVRYHFLRNLVEDGIIELIYCKTEDQVADIFTKPLKLATFSRFRELLGVCSMKNSVGMRVYRFADKSARFTACRHGSRLSLN